MQGENHRASRRTPPSKRTATFGGNRGSWIQQEHWIRVVEAEEEQRALFQEDRKTGVVWR